MLLYPFIFSGFSLKETCCLWVAKEETLDMKGAEKQ